MLFKSFWECDKGCTFPDLIIVSLGQEQTFKIPLKGRGPAHHWDAGLWLIRHHACLWARDTEAPHSLRMSDWTQWSIPLFNTLQWPLATGSAENQRFLQTLSSFLWCFSRIQLSRLFLVSFRFILSLSLAHLAGEPVLWLWLHMHWIHANYRVCCEF